MHMQEEKINGRIKKDKTRDEEAMRLRRERWLTRGRRALLEVAWGIGAWLIGQAGMLFDTHPLGVALLCGAGKHTVSILAGLLVSSTSMGELSAIYACAYLAAALVRMLASALLDDEAVAFSLPEELSRRLAEGEETADERKKEGFGALVDRLRDAVCGARVRLLLCEVRHVFSESVCLRMGTAGVAALLVSLYRIIAGGFRYYDLFAALFAVTVAVAATAVFSVSLDERSTSRLLRRISEAALLFCAVFGAGGVAVFSLPAAPVLSMFATLAICRTRGGVEGIAAGLLCGLAYAPLMAPAYLFLALSYLFFYSMGKERAALLLGSGALLAWTTYVAGATALLWAIPSSLFAGVLYSVFCRLYEYEEVDQTEDPRATADVRYYDANERLRDVCDAFTALSEVFYNLSDRLRRPRAIDLRRVCDGAFDAVCADCPNRSVCWGLEYSETLATLNGMIAALHTKGKVSEKEIGEALRERCARTETLVAHVNRECARLTGELLRNNRTEIFAMDYEGAAQIINEALLCEEEEYRADPRLERRVAVYLADAGVDTTGVSVLGGRCRRILIRGAEVDRARVTAQTLASDLGEMCDASLLPPVLSVENGMSSMIFRARQKFSVKVAKRNISADGGVSGDSVNLFTNKREYFYALISDGMGAGREAALTSGLCSVFMERMLRAGNRASTSLRMLNNMIRARSTDSADECSSTIDLLELDLMTGKCTFFKSGAAPSFVIREGVVRRMQSGSAPIGILCAPDSRETTFELRAGDTVVMISDGILDADGESDALVSVLVERPTRTPEELVERICADATARAGHDDCSAVAIRIEDFCGE